MKYFLHSVIHLKKFSIKAGEGTENQNTLIPKIQLLFNWDKNKMCGQYLSLLHERSNSSHFVTSFKNPFKKEKY